MHLDKKRICTDLGGVHLTNGKDQGHRGLSAETRISYIEEKELALLVLVKWGEMQK